MTDLCTKNVRETMETKLVIASSEYSVNPKNGYHYRSLRLI